MPLPLLAYPLTTQNARVSNLAGNQHSNGPSVGALAPAASGGENPWVNGLIEQAYRQIFFQPLSCDREPFLESQLRNGAITMRDFVRGLLLSERFTKDYYQCSSNYRIVDQVVGRALGREVHGQAERLAWSIVIAELGFTAFVDQLLDGEEYMTHFGYDRVPQQRSRLLPGHAIGNRPIYQSFPRYGADWRDAQQRRAPSGQGAALSSLTAASTWVNGQPPAWALKVWLGLAIVGSVEISRVLLTIALSMLKS